jgi:hypothetical protein
MDPLGLGILFDGKAHSRSITIPLPTFLSQQLNLRPYGRPPVLSLLGSLLPHRNQQLLNHRHSCQLVLQTRIPLFLNLSKIQMETYGFSLYGGILQGSHWVHQIYV